MRDSLSAIPAQMPCRSVASSGRGWLEAILWCRLPDGSGRGEDRGEGRNTPSIVEQNESDVYPHNEKQHVLPATKGYSPQSV